MGGVLRNVAVTAIAVAVLYWLVGLYDTALRDPRFLDGWILAAIILVQLSFHFRKQRPTRWAGQVSSWMTIHIYAGYFVIAAFIMHTDFSLPDSLLEWALWSVFVLVALSGAVGAYLSRAIPGKLEQGATQMTLENIPALRFKLAGEVDALALDSVEKVGSLAISEFYVDRLRGFFRKPRNLVAHLRGSRRPLTRMCNELDNLERYVDEPGKETLESIKDLVVAKDNLDFQYAHQGLLQTWLFLHIPATYCLIVLSVLHVAVVYAYSTGAP